jgi:hypothetical protein
MDGDRTPGTRQKPPAEAGIGGVLGSWKSANAKFRHWRKAVKNEKAMGGL